MRQQEANQFDKGLCLDNNALAIDNHTLTGALNATMITMNGNELVLQNDMGNAKVDRANLTSGFVPVGIKEFGGIVYVASYNPAKGQSELGCFPSPEQYIESENVDTSGKSITINSEEQTLKIKLLDIIRPGDQIRIVADPDINTNYIERKVLIIDSQSNESYDASDSLKVYKDSGTALDIYKGNVAGELWVQEKLIIPDYIKLNISAEQGEDESGDFYKLTFKPTAWDSDGNEFSKYTLNYTIKVTDGEAVEGESFIYKTRKDQVTYKIVPSVEFVEGNTTSKYTLNNLKLEGTVVVSQLSTGKATFEETNNGSFRYFNNILENEFELEYVMQTYIDNDSIKINSIKLAYQEVKASGNTLSLGDIKYINLPNSDYFGNFTYIINYNTSFEKGKIYIGWIEVETSKDTTPQKSGTYTIITSAVTNSYYKANPSKSMFPTNSSETLTLDWKVNWEQSKVLQSTKQLKPSAINTGSSLPSKEQLNNSISVDSRIELQTVQYGRYKQSFTPSIEIDTVDDFFPLEVNSNFNLSIGDATYSSDSITTTGNLEDSLVDSIASANVETTITSEDSIKDVTNKVWYNGQSTDNNTVDIDLGYALTSQYKAKLAENGASGEDPYVQTFESNDCTALVPYLSLSTEDESKLETLLGTSYYSEAKDNKLTCVKPTSWWTFLTWRGKKNATERKVAICTAEEDYDNTYMSESMGIIPGMDDYSNSQAVAIFTTSSTNANWKYYSSVTNDYLHNTLKIFPAICLWQGGSDGAQTLWYPKASGYGYDATRAFSIPIMFDQNGEMYVMGQYCLNVGAKSKQATETNNNLMYYIIKNFSHIYVRQSGQTVKFNYYKSSEDLDDFKYTNPFTVDVSIPLTANLNTTTLTLKGTNGVYGSKVGDYNLPKFELSKSALNNSNQYDVSVSLDSYDQTTENIIYQTAVPALTNSAIIRKDDNTTETQTFAYAGENSSLVEDLDLNHAYYLTSTGKLVDCTKYPISETSLGSSIAQAFYNKNFKIVYDSNLDYNIVVVNKATISDKIVRTTKVKIGMNDKLTLISGIAEKHVLKLPLVSSTTAPLMYS